MDHIDLLEDYEESINAYLKADRERLWQEAYHPILKGTSISNYWDLAMHHPSPLGIVQDLVVRAELSDVRTPALKKFLEKANEYIELEVPHLLKAGKAVHDLGMTIGVGAAVHEYGPRAHVQYRIYPTKQEAIEHFSLELAAEDSLTRAYIEWVGSSKDLEAHRPYTFSQRQWSAIHDRITHHRLQELRLFYG